MDVWTLALGTYQGRIQPTNWTAPSGEWVYQLGHDLPNQYVKLAVGDYNQIEQDADFTGVYFSGVQAHVRPGVTPAGVHWDLVVYIGAVEFARHEITRELDLNDLVLPIAVNILAGTGPGPIKYRLELAGTPGNYDVELPGVYLDSVSLDTVFHQPVLGNRNPEPGATGVPLDSDIYVAVYPAADETVGFVNVYVNDVPAIIDGVVQAGYSVAQGTTPDNDGAETTVTPDVPFAPLSLITVRVTTQLLGAVLTVDEYSFTTADTIAPVVTDALGTSETEVRVTFDEPVSGPGEPSDYTIVLVSGAPAVTPVVSAVTLESSTTVLLTLDTMQTAGAVYRVTVLGVEDLFGNVVAAPDNTALWTGYACLAPAGRRFTLYDMLLRSDREADLTGELRDFVGCYQEIVWLLLCRIDRFPEILDPDRAPEKYLDMMLADLGNPFAFDLTENEKQRLVQILVGIYRTKGTDVGIIDAVRLFLGLEITIEVPWHDGWILGVSILDLETYLSSAELSDRYTYVIVSQIVLTDEQRSRVTAIARYMQRLVCHFSIMEPVPPPALSDHWELGLSRSDVETWLH